MIKNKGVRLKIMDKKKVLKIAGNLLVIISLLFIIKKFCGFDIDYSLLIKPQNIIQILIISYLYGITVIALAWPWKRVVGILTGSQLPFKGVVEIFTKANLMKYLPGNVVHFIGRNELAVKYNLKHADVATSTLVDTLVSLASSGLLAIVLYFNGFRQIIEKYHLNYKLFVIVFIFLALVAVLLFVFRNIFKRYLLVLRELFKTQSILTLILNWIYDAVIGIFTSFLYIWILVGITGQPWGFPLNIVLGAVSLSSIIGFITPGAPGGIGIREAVLSILLSGIVNIESALLAIVIFRLISVVGDLMAFATIQIVIKCSVSNDKEHGKR